MDPIVNDSFIALFLQSTIYILIDCHIYIWLESRYDASEYEYDLSLFSPCKINLFLRILRKRPDNITFMIWHPCFKQQTVGFGDTLYIASQIIITRGW